MKRSKAVIMAIALCAASGCGEDAGIGSRSTSEAIPADQDAAQAQTGALLGWLNSDREAASVRGVYHLDKIP